MTIQDQIKTLAKTKKAIILAHNYQKPEIQDVADFRGDSLELARLAANNDASMIVFCGVHFMAESASILSPGKKVLLPEPTAGCPMADMIDPETVIELKKRHPKAKVVTYINSTAAVKALSDVICTSANARKIVERIEGDEIIFLPDKNLGAYVQRFTSKKIIVAEGFCPTHEKFTAEDLRAIKAKYPDAFVMVHPECRPDVIDLADGVFSTGEMVRFVAATDRPRVIVATESDMIHRLKAENPRIEYIPATNTFICPNMKKITLEKLLRSLEEEIHQISVGGDIAVRARTALDKMLELSH